MRSLINSLYRYIESAVKFSNRIKFQKIKIVKGKFENYI